MMTSCTLWELWPSCHTHHLAYERAQFPYVFPAVAAVSSLSARVFSLSVRVSSLCGKYVTSSVGTDWLIFMSVCIKQWAIPVNRHTIWHPLWLSLNEGKGGIQYCNEVKCREMIAHHGLVCTVWKPKLWHPNSDWQPLSFSHPGTIEETMAKQITDDKIVEVISGKLTNTCCSGVFPKWSEISKQKCQTTTTNVRSSWQWSPVRLHLLVSC